MREREERQRAEKINKQLQEKAKSLEMSAKETAEGNKKHCWLGYYCIIVVP